MNSSQVQIVSVNDLKSRLDRGDEFLLLDVREADEWEFCKIAGASHLPMSEIRARFGDLDSQRETVVYCHHGMRSYNVAQFLMQNGFSNVASLEGGIDAWSEQVDPALPRYG